MGRRAAWIALALALLPGFDGHAADTAPVRDVLVYAAASLTDVLNRIGEGYTRDHGTVVKFSFAGTPVLAKQLESGAKADVFISADEDWMNYVDERKLIDHASRVNLLSNRLVLIAPAGATVALKIEPRFKLHAALGANGRLSLADPDSVPAGKYAKAALTTLGVWRSAEDRIAASENVRTALVYVARGEAPLGIVYLTDARADPRVRVVDTFPESTHPHITYPAALVTGASGDGAEFFAYLRSDAAAAEFRKAGFDVEGASQSPVTAVAAHP